MEVEIEFLCAGCGKAFDREFPKQKLCQGCLDKPRRKFAVADASVERYRFVRSERESGKTFSAIAGKLGISRQRAQQIYCNKNMARCAGVEIVVH